MWSSARVSRTRTVALAPAVAVLAAWLVWIPLDGGYHPRVWYPSAIGLLLVLCACLIGGLGPLPASAWPRRALAALAALVVFSYLSVLWADWPGSALESSNKLLLLLVAAWLVAILPWSARAVTILMAIWSTGVALIFAVTLLRAVSAPDLDAFIIVDRFASPLGYSNALSSLAVMAFWPSLVLASARTTPLGLQAGFLAISAFLLEVAVLPQSRGAIVAFPFALVVLFAYGGDRLRLLGRLAIIAPAVALLAGPITDVYSATVTGRPIAPQLEAATRGMLLSALGVGAAATLLGLLERRVSPGERALRAGRLMRRAAVLALALVALGGAVVAVGRRSEISGFASDRWAVFKSVRDTPAKPGLRLTTAYSDQRYDYARVALDIFAEHPVAGAGAGNFERFYTAQRRERFYSRYAHDIWLRFLCSLGVVGFALFLAVLAALAIGLARVARGARGPHRDLIAMAAATSGFFLLAASLDWFDEMPALASPAFALPFVVLAIAPAPVRGFVARVRPGVRRVGAGLAAATALVALLTLTLPYLSDRYVNLANAAWQDSPPRAYALLSRARTLNRWSASADLAEGTIALQLHDLERARRRFRTSIAIQDAWYPRLELALLAAQGGRFTEADAELAMAARLDASDPVIVSARRLLKARGRVDALKFNHELLDQTIYKSPRLR